jgi:hypothetical protein
MKEDQGAAPLFVSNEAADLRTKMGKIQTNFVDGRVGRTGRRCSRETAMKRLSESYRRA